MMGYLIVYTTMDSATSQFLHLKNLSYKSVFCFCFQLDRDFLSEIKRWETSVDLFFTWAQTELMFFLLLCALQVWLQSFLWDQHDDERVAAVQLYASTFPVVMERQHWLKTEHISWMPWHTGRVQSKMEKKKMCPRLLDYLVVVGAR